MSSDERPPHHLIEQLHGRRARHRQRHLLLRVLISAAGFGLLVCGLAMILLPGPAVVVIPLGLAVLALEFAWAERALVYVIDSAQVARRPGNVRRTGMLSAVALAVLFVVLIWCGQPTPRFF